ncbi:hypothetical protein IJT10_02780 [bacterium]|nr:hypothetical protein [bacterium]
MRLPKKSKKKFVECTFGTSMQNFLIVSSIGVLLSIGLLFTGLSSNSSAMKYSFIGIAILIPTVCGIIYSKKHARKLTLNPFVITYDNGSGEQPLKLRFDDILSTSYSEKNKGLFDFIVITNGQDSFTVERLFFKDYDRIAQFIEEARKNSQNEGSLTL